MRRRQRPDAEPVEEEVILGERRAVRPTWKRAATRLPRRPHGSTLTDQNWQDCSHGERGGVKTTWERLPNLEGSIV